VLSCSTRLPPAFLSFALGPLLGLVLMKLLGTLLGLVLGKLLGKLLGLVVLLGKLLGKALGAAVVTCTDPIGGTFTTFIFFTAPG